MSTQRSTDYPDYTLVEIGEPTVDNPTKWYSRDIVWKVGTPQALRETRQAEIRAVATDLAALRTQAGTLAAKTGTTWTQAEIRALGSGLVKLIDDLVKIGKQALNED